MAPQPGSRSKWAKFAPLLVLAMAFPPFMNSLDNPRVAGLHGADILRLIAVGFCIGTAFGMFMAGFAGRRKAS
jgi:hypothetical protein